MLTIDKCAHELYHFINNPDTVFIKCNDKCSICGKPLEVYYCEARLYIVRCPQCKKISFVEACNPYRAAQIAAAKEVDDNEN